MRENTLLLILRIWKELSKNDALGELGFEKVFHQDIDEKSIKEVFAALSEKNEIFAAAQLGEFSKDDIIRAMRKVNGILEVKIEQSEYFDADFMSFVEQYLELENGGELYVPFASDFSFARSEKIKYFSDGDVQNASIKTSAYNTLKNINIDFRSGNAVKNPLFREPEHMIKRFKNTLALLFSPSSLSSEIDKNSSIIEAENFRKLNAFLLSFAHVLASFDDKAIVIIPSGCASRGNEKDFRKALIDDNIIEAIISLPYGFWKESGTAIKTHILLLNKHKTNADIKFLRLEDKSLKELRGNFLAYEKELKNEAKAENKNVLKLITKTELENEKYSFISDIYFTKSKIDRLKAEFDFSEEKRLDDIATLTRSQAFKTTQGEQSCEYDEVLITDIPSCGFITKASRHIITAASHLRIKNYELKPYDILLNARGNVGVVGIVGEFVQDRLCVAAQTMQIIRLKGADKKEQAIALLMYFRSKIGQLSIESISDGTLMNQIISSKLKELAVPEFTEAQRKKLLENFQKEIELNEQLEKIKAEIEKLHTEFLHYQG